MLLPRCSPCQEQRLEGTLLQEVPRHGREDALKAQLSQTQLPSDLVCQHWEGDSHPSPGPQAPSPSGALAGWASGGPGLGLEESRI